MKGDRAHAFSLRQDDKQHSLDLCPTQRHCLPFSLEHRPTSPAPRKTTPVVKEAPSTSENEKGPRDFSAREVNRLGV